MAVRRKVVLAGAVAVLVAIALLIMRGRGDAPRSDDRASIVTGKDDAGRDRGAGSVRTVPFAKRPGLRVAGIVIDETGAPLAGATVRIGSPHRRGRDAADRVTTDPAGRFDLGMQPIDVHVVTADRSGLTGAAKEIDLRDPTLRADQLHLVLYPCTASLHGTIRDSGGGVIQGANIVASIARNANGVGATSGADGRYELCVPTGHTMVLVRADGYATVSEPATAFGKTRFDVTLSPGATVVGRIVRAPGGEPVAGAAIIVSHDRRDRRVAPAYAVSDGQGRFTVDGLELGLHAITVTAEGLAASRRCEADALIGNTTEVVCELLPALTVSGRLVERGGAPVAGEIVTMFSASGETPPGDRTAVDGSFLIDHVLPGEYRVFVENISLPPRVIKVERTDVTGVVLEIDRLGSIAGRVVYGGKPVDGATVTLQWLNRTTTTDDSGAFVFRRIPAGIYQVYAESHRVGAFTNGPRVELTGNEQRTGVTVELDLSSSIEGVVVDQSDRPVPGVYVLFSLVGGHDFGTATTADDGSFQARSLAGGGEYSIEVRDRPSSGIRLGPATGGAFPPIAVRDGNTRVTGVRIQVRWDRLSIAGRVTDAAGAPAADVTVEAVNPSNERMRAPSATTDPSGAFAVRDLPAGRYVLRAEGPAGITRVDGVEAGRTDVVLKLDPPGGLDGTLVGFTNPVQVVAYDNVRVRSYRGNVTGTTFRFTRLPPGDYLVRAFGTNGGRSTVIHIEDGKRATLTLTYLGTGSLGATVRDEKTRAPVPGARCRVQNASVIAPWSMTDVAGTFRIENVPAGAYDVTCDGPRGSATTQVTVTEEGYAAVQLLLPDWSQR